jgi:AGZA family xanthine/uracil permease-like MFS transporter
MTPANHSVPPWLENWFALSARNSTIAKEFRAGTATFLSLSYIFVLAPTLLERVGLDAKDSLIAVIALSILATWAAGVIAKTLSRSPQVSKCYST